MASIAKSCINAGHEINTTDSGHISVVKSVFPYARREICENYEGFQIKEF